MLRLDPAYPPVWRSATTLQFGAAPVAVVDDPAPWQQRLVHELARGIPDEALEPVASALGAPDHGGTAFVRRIGRAIESPPAGDPPRVIVQVPSGFPWARADATATALASTGTTVTMAAWHDAPDELIADAATLVVLADHVVHPIRVAALMARDIPHLPIVFTGVGAEVGPFVRPGRTPCLACIAAHRRDADPTWPLVVSQLIGHPAAETDPSIAAEAGIVAARQISEAERSATRQTTHSLTLRAGSLHRESRRHRPHADCRCRSLAGTARADDRAVHAPTTATVIARPA